MRTEDVAKNRTVRAAAATLVAALCGPAVALLATAGPAAAATHTVTTFADVDDLGACAGSATTGTGPDGLLSLREAVCQARNAGSGTVQAAAGTYTLTLGALLIKGGSGAVDVTITGAGASSTIIDGNAADRVVNIDPTEAGGVAVTMSGLTVRNGRPTDGYGGGGILTGAPTAGAGDSLTLANCRVTGNVNDSVTTRSNAPGGGVAMAGGTLSITNCVVSGNTSGSSAGGGVYFSAQRAADTLTIDGSTFSSNTMSNTSGPGATNNGGAALALRADVAGGGMTVTDTRFADNTATGSGANADARGGAVLVRSGSPTFTRTTFTGNTATGSNGAQGQGGALYALGTASVTNSRIIGNTASTGGAVYHAGAGTLTASRNWWGCNAGPGSAGCDTVTSGGGSETLTPRLQLGVVVAPPSIVNGGAATATASFRTDSASGDVPANQLGQFTGLPVTWSATGGTLSAQQATIQSGQGAATATFTGSSVGSRSVSATVDGQQADGAVAVTTPPTPPAAPTIGAATVAGSGALQVSWTAPAGTVDSYRVYVASGGSYTAAAAGTCAGTPVASPCTVTGLTPGTQHTFQVSGVNVAGEGPQSGPSAAVTAIATPDTPGQPTVTVAGDRSLKLAWTAPTPPVNEQPVTSYRVVVSVDEAAFTAVNTGACANPTGLECVMTGLADGASYRFRVTGVNAAGTGKTSPISAPVVAVAAPAAPTVGTVTVTGSGVLTVPWTAPSGTVDSYRVWISSGGPYTAVSAGTCAGSPTASPCTVTGLTPGSQYTFQVSAVRSTVEGPRSAASPAVTALAAATAPTAVTATPTDGGATVSWTAPQPADGITGYTATVQPGGIQCDASLTGCALTGLTNGTTYTVTVVAHSPAGDSPASAPVTFKAGLPPGAPTIGTVTVTGSGVLTVPWTAPSGTVDSYRVWVSSGGSYTAVSAGTCAGSPTASPCTVTGLTAGSQYTFQVSAVAHGLEGPRSAASPAVTALATAAAPTAVTVTPTDGGATISWTAPQPADGITGYLATVQPGGATCSSTGTTCAVTGLTNGTVYTVTVVANSPAGNSTASASATVRPGVAPGRPTAVQAVAGVASIMVSWTAPASAGTGITGYLVTASPGPATCETTGATTCVLGAEAGKDYTVTVVARGTHGGDSAASDPSTTARPTTPAPPATPPATTLTLSTDKGTNTRVAPGEKIVVSGTGFAPYSTVTVTVYSEPVVLTTVTADGTGAFSVPVTVPDGLAVGQHSFVALGVDPGGQTHSLRLDLTVPAGASAPADALPVTGAGVILMILTGLGLLLAGATLRSAGSVTRRWFRV